MDAYERSIIRQIYEAACSGSGKALRILETLTTKRRQGKRCPVCGGFMRSDCKTYCSQMCSAHRKRTWKSRLTPEQVLDIQSRYWGIVGKFQGRKILAAEFGISPSYLSHIASGRGPIVRRKRAIPC